MKKLLLAALIGTAAAVAPLALDVRTIPTCENDNECRLWGDTTATCNFNTKQCTCTPSSRYINPTLNGRNVAICVNENEDGLALRLPLVFTIQYPRGSCNVTGRAALITDYITTMENTIGKALSVTFSCAEPSGVNVAVHARVSLNDVFTVIPNFPIFWQPGGTGSRFVGTSALVTNFLGSQSKFPQVNNHKGLCNLDFGALYMARVDDMCIAISCDAAFDLINGQCIQRLPRRPEDDDIPDGVVVAIVLGVLLFIVLVTTLVVCLRAYQRPDYSTEDKMPLTKETPRGPDEEDDEY